MYHVAGKPDIDGTETVTITQISEAAYQLEQKATQEAATLETQSAIAELSIIIAAARVIDFDDRRRLNDMHSCYHNGLGGNGDLDTLMEEVNSLPLKVG